MADDETPNKPESILLYEAGSEFFNQNYLLLGAHVADFGQNIGEVDANVQDALNKLAIATANRMTQIMQDGPARA